MKQRLSVLACAAALASLSGCGSDNNSSPATSNNTVSGVAAQGAPLVGVPVTVTDSTGHAVQSPVTDANGNFSITITGQAPFVLTVPTTDADGSAAVLSSVIDPQGDGSLTANLNPLTSLITQRALGVTLTGAPTAAQITNAKLSPDSITQATTTVTQALQPLLAAAGVTGSTLSNPIASSYVANASNPLDNMFDLAHFTVHTNTVEIGNSTPSATPTPYIYQLPLTGTAPAFPAAEATEVEALASGPTTTPIQHVVVIVAENQTFDGLYGTYQAPAGQTVKNLLSEGIVNADGSPGPNFALAQQNQAAGQSTYTLNPPRAGAYTNLPSPQTIGIVEFTGLLTSTGSVTFDWGQVDPNFAKPLPNGPFQITASAASGSTLIYDQPDAWLLEKAGVPANAVTVPTTAPYQLYTALGQVATSGDPVHRFFQMWQQNGGDNSKLDLYTWVATTAGQGGDTFENAGQQITPTQSGQGGELMGFMNMAAGDAPYWKQLAQQGAMSDNYHQSIQGGTGMNFFSIATADLPYFNNGGAVTPPPANQIENPNPMQGVANPNFYTQDGYSGGSYVNCSDAGQPGVAAILNYLASKHVPSNCESGKYYLVNNYTPGYDTAGNPQPIGPNNFSYPPQTVPTIAEALAKKGVTWGWYTAARDTTDVTAAASALGFPAATLQAFQYNNIGDPLVGSKNVMTNSALSSHLQDQTAFMTAATSGTLPAVSFLVPPNLQSGHPGNSSPFAFEGWLKTVLASIQGSANWSNTAVIITTDEGGGHFDTGPIQTVDFFGDGPRIPLIVLSPYAKKNTIDHVYSDHASILKFIERNWRLTPLSSRSRDRLPNPVMPAGGYLPANQTPALGDLMSMFNF